MEDDLEMEAELAEEFGPQTGDEDNIDEEHEANATTSNDCKISEELELKPTSVAIAS